MQLLLWRQKWGHVTLRCVWNKLSFQYIKEYVFGSTKKLENGVFKIPMFVSLIIWEKSCFFSSVLKMRNDSPLNTNEILKTNCLNYVMWLTCKCFTHDFYFNKYIKWCSVLLKSLITCNEKWSVMQSSNWQLHLLMLNNTKSICQFLFMMHTHINYIVIWSPNTQKCFGN